MIRVRGPLGTFRILLQPGESTPPAEIAEGKAPSNEVDGTTGTESLGVDRVE